MRNIPAAEAADENEKQTEGEKMADKIVLIDGHSILNRAFYGIPVLTNSEGKHTNAVYGFLNIMFKVLEEEQAEYCAVAFDLHAPTFRHKMYDAYKGTRKPMPEELREQVPMMKEFLAAMNIPVMTLEGYEADDILGTVSRQMEQEGLKVSVLSGDRDLLQLATDEILIRIPKTKATGTEIEDYYAADVKAKYQVTPKEFIDVKALMGDASDNIPGVPSIGEKTATKLIVQFGSIEEAYAHVDEITPPRAREALRSHYDLAQMSKTLAEIDLHVPYTLDKEKARLDNMYSKEALDLCRKLEFKNLIGRFSAADEPEVNAEETYRWIRDFSEADKILNECAGKIFAFQLLEEDGTVLGAALSFSERETYFLECGGFLTQEYLCSTLSAAVRGAGKAVTFGWKQQLSRLEADDFGNNVFDARIAAYLLNPLKGTYEYEDLAHELLNWMIPTRNELFGKKKLTEAKEKDPEKFLQYAGRMVLTTRKALDILEEKLADSGMKQLFEEIEMPLVYVLHHMEQEGIGVQKEALKEYGDQLTGRIAELERTIYSEAGEEFNINSPKQLGVILFEKLQLPHGKKTKTGYSTAADVLEKLSEEYPVVAHILEYRQLTKLKSTYADGLAAYIAADGRIHGKFHQTITATGRLSSTEPNLQNIPIRMELGRLIRKVFVAKEHYVFLDADYSQIELRVLAHMSGDERLIQAYQEAQDIHTITASQVFHVRPEEVTPLLRRNAKAVNFGIVYGISSFGLSQDLSITRKEAQEYIEQYFEVYPGIREFLDRTVENAKKDGYVTTMFGRRRPMPELKASNFMQRSFGERVAMNAPIQGTAADIIKIAMIRVDQKLRERNLKSKLILQVHDELLIETAEDELEEVSAILREEMMHAADLKVRLEIDVHSGKDWYEAK